MAMVNDLRLMLLGSPQVFSSEYLIDNFITSKAEALLYYLATTGRVHTRIALAGLLWPEVPDQVALKNLRDIISNLRKLVGDHLLITRQTMGFDGKQPHFIDSVQIHTVANNAPKTIDIAALEKAVALYQGEFLEGFHIRDAAPFEEWLLQEREQLRTNALHLMHLLTAHYVDIAAWAEGLQITQRILTLEPWDEAAHRQQMRLLAGSGQRGAALQQYERCKAILAQEFAIEPVAETQALNELIRSHATVPQMLLRNSGTTELRSNSTSNNGTSNNGTSGAEIVEPAANRLTTGEPTITTNSLEQQAKESHLADWDLLRKDLDVIPQPPFFVGRQQELQQLTAAVCQPDIRLITIIGLGGQGKTALAAHFATTIIQSATQQAWLQGRSAGHVAGTTADGAVSTVAATGVARILWYSCQNAPPLREILSYYLTQLAESVLNLATASTLQLQNALLAHAQRAKILLILDNFESYLLPPEVAATAATQAATASGEIDYRASHDEELAEIEAFLHSFATMPHNSKLVLTSREQPASWSRLKGESTLATLQLQGMHPDDAVHLLQLCQIFGTSEDLLALTTRYAGHPLALKIMAEAVHELFTGNVASFLQEDPLVFDGIRNLLAQQFMRLSPLELEIVLWIALSRDSVTPQQIWNSMLEPPPRNLFFEALRTLQRCSLVETEERPKRFSRQIAAQLRLPAVVLEYASAYLINAITQELMQEQFVLLHRYALVKAQDPDYMRQAQIRFSLQPIAQHLTVQWGIQRTTAHLDRLLLLLQQSKAQIPSYAAANLLHLMQHLHISLAGKDFSALTIRQADFRRTHLAHANLSGVELTDCAFADYFGGVLAVAFSPDSRLMAGAMTDGNILIWRTSDGQQVGVCHGNGRWIWTVAFSPDGQYLASGCADAHVRIWDIGDFYISSPTTPSGSVLIRKLFGHTNAIFSVAYSPDGKLLASGSADGKICIWQAKDGTLYRTLEQHTAAVFAVAFDPSVTDGRLLASGSRDRTAKIWDTATGEVLHELSGHTDEILSVAYQPSGNYLVTGAWDHTVRIWSTTEGTELAVWDASQGPVLSVACHIDDDTVAAAGNDHTIYLWSLATGKLKLSLQGHFRAIGTLAFAGDGHTFVSGSFDQTIRLWDSQHGYPLRTYHGYANEIQSLTLNADGRYLANANVDQTICIWDAKAAAPDLSVTPSNLSTQRHSVPHQIIQNDDGPVFCVAFHPEHNLLASAGQSGTIRIWDVAQAGRLTCELRRSHDAILSLAFSADGKWLASGTEDRTIFLWDLEHRHCVRIYECHTKMIETLAFTPDGNYLLCGNDDGAVAVWPVPYLSHTGMTPQVNAAYNGTSDLLSPHADGHALDVAMLDTAESATRPQLSHLLVNDGTEQTVDTPYHLIQTATNGVNVIAISQDNRLLAIGGANPQVELWQLPTGHQTPSLLMQPPLDASAALPMAAPVVSTAAGNYQRVQIFPVITSTFALAFSPDGTLLAGGGGDRKIYIWDLERNEQQQVLSEHGGTVRSLIFAAGGELLYGSGDGEMIHIWRRQNREWIEVGGLQPPGIYHGLNIYGTTGIHMEKRLALHRLGAIEHMATTRLEHPPHNLPTTLTPFYGRDVEREQLLEKLLDPDTHLVTLWGEGGVGKTRLATELGHLLLSANLPHSINMPLCDTALGQPAHWVQFRDGIWFIPLTDVQTNVQVGAQADEQIAAAIGATLNIAYGYQESLVDQLFTWLHPKRLLLLLDRFEHLAGGTDFLVRLMQAAPHVKIVVTSRHRLDLLAQRLHRLQGLAIPTMTEAETLSLEELLAYAGIRLFVERVERTLGEFTLTAENRRQIVTLCHLINGLPLGIELAATQLQQHTLEEIIDTVQTDLAMLASSAQDIPPHQRSLETVLQYSVKNIDEELQQVFTCCAVFQDGFDINAATVVARAARGQLQALTAHSLLRHLGHDRYIMHEFIRTFARQQQPQHETCAQIQERHATYYLTLLKQRGQRASSTHTDLQLFKTEIENIRAAWRWLLGTIETHAQPTSQQYYNYLQLLRQSIPSFFYLFERLGYHQETEEIAEQAIACIHAQLSPQTPGQMSESDTSASLDFSVISLLKEIKAALLVEYAIYNSLIGNVDFFHKTVQDAIALTNTIHVPEIEAKAYHILAIQQQQEGDFDSAYLSIGAIDALARRHNLLEWQIAVRNLRGIFYDMQGDRLRAMAQYRIALPLAIEAGDLYQEKLLVNNMGLVTLGIGEWDQAKEYLERNVLLSETLGNPARHAFALMNHAQFLDVMGLYTDAEQELQQALQVAQDMRHRQAEVYTLQFLSMVSFHTGNHTAGYRYAEESLILIERHGMASMRAQGLTLAGHHLLTLGERERALATYGQAINLWRAMDDELEIYTARAGYAFTAMQLHKVDEARMIVEEICQVIDDLLRQKLTGGVWIALGCYYIFHILNDKRAKTFLQKAHEYIHAQAERISDVGLRESFLKNVFANRTIIRLMQDDA